MCTFFLVVAFRDARFLSGLYGRFSYIVKFVRTPLHELPLDLDVCCERKYVSSLRTACSAVLGRETARPLLHVGRCRRRLLVVGWLGSLSTRNGHNLGPEPMAPRDRWTQLFQPRGPYIFS